MYLKQSTSRVITFGPAVSQSDGVTLVTTLVSALDNATTGIKLSKAGGALTIRHATVTATTYDTYGNYLVTLDATDTNTLGSLRVQFADATTNLPIWADFEVVTANVYNALIGGTDNLDVNALKVGPTGAGTAQTARDLGLALPAVAPNTNGGLPILSSSGTTLGYTVTTVTTTTTATNLTNAPTAGDLTAAMKASVTAAATAATPTVTAGTVSDKTGYSLTQTFPANFSSFSIDASGRVDLAKIKGTASAGAAGYVGIDWANVNAPTTTVVLSGTTIGTLTTYTGNTLQTGDSYAIVNSGTFGNSALNTALTEANADLDELITTIGAAGAGLTAVALVSTGLNAVLIDTKTLPVALQLIAAATAGKLSGAGTTTETFVGIDGSTTRIVGTVDSSGNRTAASYP